MTSAVKVSAHCASNKEVVITIDNGSTGETVVIQDGETYDASFYDEKVISVKERLKEEITE